MITHVQTALRKAGNYDKTGRARKNMCAFRVHSKRRRGGWGEDVKEDTWFLGHREQNDFT